MGKIVLTGGHGMVGSNILEHPLAKDWEIIAPSSSELDLTDYDATLSFLKETAPDVVIHAAGRVGGIQANIDSPVDFLVTNLDMGRNIVLAARATDVRKLINLGSSCMYPRNAENPLTEDMILKGELEPTNEGYALAKVVTARLCEYINREQSELYYKTMVPCNLYGRHDKFDPKHSHLIPAIIHKIYSAKINNLDTVEIWGDGTAKREFMYAEDFADAIMYALEKFETLPDLVNIGLGYDKTINEYYKTVAEVIGWDGTFIHDLSKPVGMKQKLVSTQKMDTFGWKAKTSLKEGIEKTYQYYLLQKAQ